MSAGSTTVREAVMAVLRAFSMTKIFGNPGSTELPMLREFPSDFEYVLGLQEAVVVAMADGYAQATRNASFVNLHSAAGLGNGLGAVFTAFRNQTPLIVTAGQQARSIMPFEPYLFAPRAAEFAQPYVKSSIEPARAEDVPLAIEQAYHLAMQEPRGPVFVSVPVDDWDRSCEAVIPRRVSTITRGDPHMLAEVAAALANASRPALVVGPSIARDDAWDEAIALAEKHGAAVWATPQAPRNAFPEDHPLFMGSLRANRPEIVAALAGNDVIVALGAPVFLYHVEGEGPHLPAGAVLYQLIDNPSLAVTAAVGTAIVTSLKPGIADLLDGPPPITRVAPAHRAPVSPPPAEMTDAYVYSRIAALRPHDAIMVEEAPSSRRAMRQHCPAILRDGFYAGSSGGLGFGLPAAIGVSMAKPYQRVLAVIGDGSMMYGIPALWNAARQNLNVCFIVLNNSRYQALVEFSKIFGLTESQGTNLDGLDFVSMAQGHGVPATLVTSTGTLDQALAEGLSCAGPRLIEIRIS